MDSRVNRVSHSWNPLHCGGTELQPQVLLCAKLLALVFWRFGLWSNLPQPFNPFLPVYPGHAGAAYVIVLKAVLMLAFLCIWFNRQVRNACLVAGICILMAVLSSRTYFENNKLFAGCVFFLIGLTPRDQTPLLLRWQVALLYFGAGLNKWTDVDWRSGQFFVAWAPRFVVQPVYHHLAAALPGHLLARAMSWVAISTELSLSIAFLTPALLPIGIWTGLFFHTGLFWLTDREFGIFLYAMAAAYLTLKKWPDQVTVLYDGDCGFCARTRAFMERFDLEHRFRWLPLQETTHAFAIPEAALRKRLHIVDGKKIASGFAAFKNMLLYNPLTYFAIFLLLSERQPEGFHYRKWLALGLVVLFSPLVNPIGEAVYDWIAKNRHRIPGRQLCSVEQANTHRAG